MNVEQTVIALTRLPMEFTRLGDRSFYDLLKETRYFEVYDQISEAVLIDGLKRSSDCVTAWMQYSEDKRSSSGWYILGEQGKYIVGFLSENGTKKIEKQYSDPIIACASFIKNEIEQLRGLA